MPQNWTPQSYDYSQWNDDKYRAAAEAAAREVGIDPDFLFRIGKFGEGGGTFNPRINPDSGARGPWQAIPSTYRKMGYTDQQADDPNISARIGARVLSDMQARFGGDDNWALAGYSGHQSDIQAGKLGPDALAYISRVKGGQPVTAGDVGMKPGQLHDVLSSMPELQRMYAAAASALQQENAAWQQDVQQRGQQAGQRRDQMFGQIQEQINQPAPENDPKAELFTRLAGGLSQALAPRLNGQQQAQDVMGQRLSAIREQRMQSLSMLVRQYQQAAQEASNLGDRAAELKHLNKAASLGKELEGLAGVMKTVASKSDGGGGGSKKTATNPKRGKAAEIRGLYKTWLSPNKDDKERKVPPHVQKKLAQADFLDVVADAEDNGAKVPDFGTFMRNQAEQLVPRGKNEDDQAYGQRLMHQVAALNDKTLSGYGPEDWAAWYGVQAEQAAPEQFTGFAPIDPQNRMARIHDMPFDWTQGWPMPLPAHPQDYRR